jgi:ankyrin repeat protein
MIESLDMVKLLLQHRANVNAEDMFLQKPLYFALIHDNVHLVKLLLACRATPWDPYLRDYFAACKS